MSSNILSQIKTKEEYTAFKEGLGFLIESAFKLDNEMFLKLVKQNFESYQTQIISQYLNGAEGAQAVEKALRKLLIDIDEIEELRLILSFNPKFGFIERLSFWFKSNFGQNVILNISVDPTILGGLVVEYKGKYTDLTLARQLDEYFIKNHDKIKSYI